MKSTKRKILLLIPNRIIRSHKKKVFQKNVFEVGPVYVARITGQRVSVNVALKFKYLVDGSIIDKRKFGIRCDVF